MLDGADLQDQVEHMITDVVPLAEGPALLADLAARRRHVIQAVLSCD